jgi:hypothetical protein
MSRPQNPNNVYELVDAVTGKTVNTNPKQFRELMSRYNLSQEELQKSYVSQEGRNQLAADKETAETAVQKYNLHPNVANQLKALRVKTPKPRKSKAVESVSVEVPANEQPEQTVTEEASETPVDAGEEQSAVEQEEEILV